MKNSERSFILKVQKDHHVFFKQHKTDGVEKRIQYLKKLKKLLDKKEASILDALFLDLKKPADTDNLEDTVNYDEAVSIIVAIFTEKSYNLIESVGDKICTKLLKYYPITKVKIKIRKPHAPIMANLDTVEVELEREKL